MLGYGAGQSVAPNAQLLEVLQQPRSRDWLEKKETYHKRKRKGRKEAKIDNGFCLFAFCSLSHSFQFYSTTTRTKTAF